MYWKDNELNQLTSKNNYNGTTYYTYDKRGNRVQDKLSNYMYKQSMTYEYDATNHLVKGASSSTVTSEYTWNGLGLRVNNTQTDQKKAVLDRDYIIDYTDGEHNDLAIYAGGYYQSGLYNDALYEQKNLYADGSFVEQYYHQYNDKNGNGEKWALHYIHEDIMGSVVRYSAENPAYDDPYYSASFYKEFNYEEHVYDAYGAVQESGGYLNDGKTTVIEPAYTGHPYDSVLSIYYADARFYDAANRQWMSSDPAKDGLNWYQYVGSNPTTYVDPTGESLISPFAGFAKLAGSAATAVKSAAGSITNTANKASKSLSKWWENNKTSVAKTAATVAVGAVVTAGVVAITVGTGGTAAAFFASTGGRALVSGIIGAASGGIGSVIDQKAAGEKVNWATVGTESLKGGVIGGLSGAIGGAVAGKVSGAFDAFCGEATSTVVGTVAKKWTVGTVSQGVAGTAATFASNLAETRDLNESLTNTGDSLGSIWAGAAITNSVAVAAEAAVTPKCFVAGTMVATIGGLKAIETIQTGDVVLSENEETGEVAYKEVVRTFVNSTDEITHVTIQAENGEIETIDATPQHPFYVEGKGWVEANALHAGMVVWLADGTKAIVRDVTTEALAEPVTVYNFEVRDFHTYFVGDSGVLVHNTCGLRQESAAGADGKWVDVNESMSESSRNFQQQVTGMSGKSWLQNGVKFDGNIDGTLIDAKGHYAQFVNPDTGEYYSWFSGTDSFVAQAMRQIAASNGASIEWHFAEQAALDATKKLFADNGISEITLILQDSK